MNNFNQYYPMVNDFTMNKYPCFNFDYNQQMMASFMPSCGNFYPQFAENDAHKHSTDSTSQGSY